MDKKQLQEKLHKQIPLTKLMQLKIEDIDEKKLISTAPLCININDKGTGFAGSLLTLATISAWSVVFLVCEKLGFKPPIIAIVKNESTFSNPVTNDLNCINYFPTQEEMEILKDKLLNKKSGSIKIKSQIIENDKVCLEFEGVYVVKL